MKSGYGQNGFVLITVLIVTAVGLLFGVGALLLFRFQCQLRIERQHELEKVYAVRSALNDIRTLTKEIPDAGRCYRYHTIGSQRDLNLIVKPVEAIFPNLATNHFAMERGDFRVPDPVKSSPQNLKPGFYDLSFDYECGAEGVTNLLVRNTSKNEAGYYKLEFYDKSAPLNVKWWINIGMSGTGGWLQDDYGRRYCVSQIDYVGAENVPKDIMRLCLIRDIENHDNTEGRQHGWPLSMKGERAIVLEIRPTFNGVGEDYADIRVYEYECLNDSGFIKPTELEPLHISDWPRNVNIGIQLAEDNVSLFYIENDGNNDDLIRMSSHGYVFSDSAKMTAQTYGYFVQKQTFRGVEYPGVETVDGKVHAPDLRAVLEYEAFSPTRQNQSEVERRPNVDSLTKFRVTPAYQYNVYVEHPILVTNCATIAQKVGKYRKTTGRAAGLDYSIVTYDTHGTENKGFRKDEREAERKRNRR